jgi:hypothetical protein
MYTGDMLAPSLRYVAQQQTRACAPMQCGISTLDHANVLNAEKIAGGGAARPCAVATGGSKPAADHAGDLAAGLALASAMFSAPGATSAERTAAYAWRASAEEVFQWGKANPGLAKSWNSDVRVRPPG